MVYHIVRYFPKRVKINNLKITMLDFQQQHTQSMHRKKKIARTAVLLHVVKVKAKHIEQNISLHSLSC